MSTLLLKFSGPLQSWGTSSYYDTRDTDPYPSKSAVIGMIAASLGYRREEQNKIDELKTLHVGVRIDQSGYLVRDYHIAKGRKKKSATQVDTFVTNRYYLSDAIFLVAISHEDEELMIKISDALKHPYFQLFLGRRSVPINYDFYLEMNDQSIEENLRNYPWQAADWYKDKNRQVQYLEAYIDSALIPVEELRNYQIRRDNVVSFSQKHRQFKARREAILHVPVASINSGEQQVLPEHDPFTQLEGE